MRTAGWRRAAGVTAMTVLVAAMVTMPDARSQTAPTLALDPASGLAGTKTTVVGRSFVAGFPVTIWWDDRSGGPVIAADVPVGRDGSFQTDVVVPSGAAPGSHDVIACQPDSSSRTGCRAEAIAVFRVQAPPTTTTAPTTTTTAPTTTTTAPTTTTTGVIVAPTTTTTAPTTTTTLPLASSTTTLPPTTTTLPLASSTTTTTTLPDLSAPPTTVGGYPPPPSTIGPGSFGVSTTTSQPPLVAPSGIENLAITDLEVTQGLQDLENRFPLVAGRRTIVRVFGISETDNPDGQAGVMAAVQGIRLDGGPEDLGMVFSEDPAVFDDTRHRSTHEYSPYVILPESWAEGTVELRVWIWSGDPTAGNEPTAEDNLAEITVEFHPTPVVHLWYWPLYMTEDFDPSGDPVIWYPGDGWLAEHLFVYRIWPVSGLFAHPMNTVVGDASDDFDLTEDGNSAAPNAVLDELYQLNEPGDWHLYSGMVHSSLNPLTKFAGFASGVGVSTWSVMGLGFWGVSNWFHASGHVVAHEGGHAFGLAHAPCEYQVGDPIPGEVAGGAIDPTFPGSYGWPACTLAPQGTEGFYGLDVYWEVSPAAEPTILSNFLSAEAPNAAFPWMGYRNPGWMDPWHGCYVLSQLGVPCTQTDLVFIDTDSPTGGGIPTPAPHPQSPFDCNDWSFGEVDACQFAPTEPFDPTAAEEDAVITGFLNTTTGEAELMRAYAVGERRAVGRPFGGADPGDPPSTPDLDGATHLLAALDEDGVALWLAPIPVETSGHAGEEDGDHAFSLRIPRMEGTARYAVLGPEGVLAELGPSPSVPEVAATASVGEVLTIEVEAADADGDVLWTSVRYRPDPGSPWQPVSASTTAGTITVDYAHLAGSVAGTLQLLTTDGFHTVATDLTVVLPQQAPQVLVVSPVNGAERPAGRPVDLRAQVLDPEDGVIDEVRWISDVDGEVATGAVATVDSLSEGVHRLTALAADSSGTEGSSTIELTIVASDLPDASVVAAVTGVFADGPPPAPAPPAGGSGGLVAVAVIVPVLVLAGLLVLRRRRRASGAAA